MSLLDLDRTVPEITLTGVDRDGVSGFGCKGLVAAALVEFAWSGNGTGPDPQDWAVGFEAVNDDFPPDILSREELALLSGAVRGQLGDWYASGVLQQACEWQGTTTPEDPERQLELLGLSGEDSVGDREVPSA